MGEYVIETKNLIKQYGTQTSVANLNMQGFWNRFLEKSNFPKRIPAGTVLKINQKE